MGLKGLKRTQEAVNTVDKKHLLSALGKTTHQDGRQWGGYLTPVEILALTDDGAKTNTDLVRIRESRDKGISGGQWFYFTPSKEQLAELLKREATR